MDNIDKSQDNQKIVKGLIETADNFQTRFENDYDVNMVYFGAINFALYMISRFHRNDETLIIFKSYFEFTLSYFLLCHYEKLPIINEYFISELLNYQDSKSMSTKLMKQLYEEYFSISKDCRT